MVVRDVVYPRRMNQGCAKVIFGGALVAACSASAPAARDTAGGPSPTPVKVEPVKAEPKPEVKKEDPKPETAKVEPEPTDDSKPASALAAANFMFVFRGDVVVESAAQEAWGTGKVRSKKTKLGREGRQDVDAAKLPEPLRALEGARVALYGASGKVCEATLKGLGLYGLSERGDEDADGGMPSEPALVAGLTDKQGSCAGALWARKADLPAPVVYAPEAKPDRALVAKVQKAFSEQAAYTQLALAYVQVAKDLGDKTPWDKFAAKHFRAQVWAEVGGSRKLVTARVGNDEWIRCDAYLTESATAVFEANGDELKAVANSAPWHVDAVLDADGDGNAELLWSRRERNQGLVAAGREEKTLRELAFPSEGPYDDCPQDDAEP